MKYVSKLTLSQISKKLLGKSWHFQAECSLFPSFDVVGRALYIHKGQLMKVKTNNGKEIDVDLKMNGLKYEKI